MQCNTMFNIQGLRYASKVIGTGAHFAVKVSVRGALKTIDTLLDQLHRHKIAASEEK